MERKTRLLRMRTRPRKSQSGKAALGARKAPDASLPPPAATSTWVIFVLRCSRGCGHGDGRRFVLRIEDIDRVRSGSAQRQIDELKALGIDWDGEVLIQSSRAHGP